MVVGDGGGRGEVTIAKLHKEKKKAKWVGLVNQ